MKCPGQDTMYWKPGAIYEVACPKCGKNVEFFKDDTNRRCAGCGYRFVNPEIDFGCAAYCQYAKECIGTLPDDLRDLKENLLKDRVAIEMKRYFKKDFKRIGHAMKVGRYAEKIGKEERADMSVVMCSAYLHDIGIHEAEQKYGSTAPKLQEKEGPAIAYDILSKLDASEDLKTKVCDIIGHHHHPRPYESLEFKVLYDSDRIANLETNLTKKNGMKKEKIIKIIEKQFLTKTGKKIAAQHLTALSN